MSKREPLRLGSHLFKYILSIGLGLVIVAVNFGLIDQILVVPENKGACDLNSAEYLIENLVFFNKIYYR